MTPFTGDESKTLQVSHKGTVGSGSQLSGILKLGLKPVSPMVFDKGSIWNYSLNPTTTACLPIYNSVPQKTQEPEHDWFLFSFLQQHLQNQKSVYQSRIEPTG